MENLRSIGLEFVTNQGRLTVFKDRICIFFLTDEVTTDVASAILDEEVELQLIKCKKDMFIGSVSIFFKDKKFPYSLFEEKISSSDISIARVQLEEAYSLVEEAIGDTYTIEYKSVIELINREGLLINSSLRNYANWYNDGKLLSTYFILNSTTSQEVYSQIEDDNMVKTINIKRSGDKTLFSVYAQVRATREVYLSKIKKHSLSPSELHDSVVTFYKNNIFYKSRYCDWSNLISLQSEELSNISNFLLASVGISSDRIPSICDDQDLTELKNVIENIFILKDEDNE